MTVSTDQRKTGVIRGIAILAQSAVAVTAPLDTNENVLATITIPGGAMGPDGSIRIRAQFSCDSSVNSKTFRVRFSGAAGTAFTSIAITANSYVGTETWISNTGATNSQIGGAAALSTFASGGLSATAPTGAVDTNVDTTVVITAQKALGAEAAVLKRYQVELLA